MRIYIAIHEWNDLNTNEQTYEILGVFSNEYQANERLINISSKMGFLKSDKYFIQEDNLE